LNRINFKICWLLLECSSTEITPVGLKESHSPYIINVYGTAETELFALKRATKTAYGKEIWMLHGTSNFLQTRL